MGIHNLDKIFKPKAIAIAGAGSKQDGIGTIILDNLLTSGYQGRLYPVNPKHQEIKGLKCHPSIKEINDPVDLAVIAAPISSAPAVIRDCAAVGVGGAIIISAGGKEVGAEGRVIEDEIKKEAEIGNVRIVGPNCLGVISTRNCMNATFAHHMSLPGKMAFISQSGAVCTAILDWALEEKIGFSHFVSIGSMLDVDFGDLIDYLGDDSRVSSILLYIENLTNVRKFMSAARAVSRVKPILALKTGRSRAGAMAAASHTGSMAGEDAVYDEAFRRAGLIRINTFEELFDCAELAAKQPRPRGAGLAIITNSGGPGVMAADELAACGLEPASLSADTLARLDEAIPRFWSRGNPIDILGDATLERYASVVKICMDAPEINALVIILCPVAVTSPSRAAEALSEMLQKTSFPVFMVWMGGADVAEGRRILNRAGLPTYSSPERAVRAFWHMFTYDRNLKLSYEVPRRFPDKLQFNRVAVSEMIRASLNRDRRILTEIESKELLSDYGVPVNRTMAAVSSDEAARLAVELGFPVALKLLSPDITHKTDAGGVKLGLECEEDVIKAFNDISSSARAFDPKAEIWGVSVQKMVRRPEFELIMGVKKDEQFGPVLLFGMGGVMTEVLRDRALGLPPLNRLLARRMMEATKVYQLLKGVRGRPPANIERLEEILICLSQLVSDFPEISELDMNPVIAMDDDVMALDARVVLAPSSVSAPDHLIISPYPNQYESTTVTKGGVNIKIRPIRPEDATMLQQMHKSLSDRSVYMRFCHPLKELSPQLLARFTQIDYDREVALVAMEADHEKEAFLGVARSINDVSGDSAELAVVVTDAWQGKGVGAALMELCMAITLERGVKKLSAYILPENYVMRSLVRKLGWTCTKVGDDMFYYESKPDA